MNDKRREIAWVGDMYRKFEAMCMEVDDIMHQEDYVESPLHTAGTNVKQFWSDLMQDVLPQTVDTVITAECDSSLKTDRNLKFAKGVDKDNLEEEPCNVSLLFHSFAMEPIKAAQYVSFLEQTVGLSSEGPVDSGMYEIPKVSASKNHPIEEPYLTEMWDKLALQEKDPTLSVQSAASSNCVNLILANENEVLGESVTSVDAPAKSIRNPDDAVEDVAKLRSTFDGKLDESCIIVDSSGLPFVSEAWKHSSYKKKIVKALSAKWNARKQDDDRHASLYGKPDSGSDQRKGEGEDSASTSTITSGHEFCESDWEII